jgi:hypothetical protein
LGGGQLSTNPQVGGWAAAACGKPLRKTSTSVKRNELLCEWSFGWVIFDFIELVLLVGLCASEGKEFDSMTRKIDFTSYEAISPQRIDTEPSTKHENRTSAICTTKVNDSS